MSKLSSIIGSIFNYKKFIEIDVKNLPSRGMFYPEDFKIKIKAAEKEDIEKYHSKYIDGDFISILTGIKWVIRHNIKLTKEYSFKQISSIDVLYIFLEIVKLTQKKDIYISFDDVKIKFCSENFNYFELDEKYFKHFDKVNREFVYDGFKYSLPTIGVESSITRFLYDMSKDNRLSEFKNSSYDFLYFLGGKKGLKNEEIENLITIFNDELSDKDKKIVSSIIDEFRGFSKYSLKSEGVIVPLEGIDLKYIWNI